MRDLSDVYEVITYKDSENPQIPESRDILNTKALALKIAKQKSVKYPLVEVNTLTIIDGNMEDIDGERLICVYRNGKRR